MPKTFLPIIITLGGALQRQVCQKNPSGPIGPTTRGPLNGAYYIAENNPTVVQTELCQDPIYTWTQVLSSTISLAFPQTPAVVLPKLKSLICFKKRRPSLTTCIPCPRARIHFCGRLAILSLNQASSVRPVLLYRITHVLEAHRVA